MAKMLFGPACNILGFSQEPAAPDLHEEASQLDSTTVDDLDLLSSTAELFAAACAQTRRRGLKVKRLRAKLRAERVNVKETQVMLSRYMARSSEAHSALSKLQEEYDRADGAARSLGFDLAKAITQIENLREALRRANRRAPEDAQEAVLPACVICLDRPRTHVLIPCGHAVLCEECANTLADSCSDRGEDLRCPICKSICDHVQKLFF